MSKCSPVQSPLSAKTKDHQWHSSSNRLRPQHSEQVAENLNMLGICWVDQNPVALFHHLPNEMVLPQIYHSSSLFLHAPSDHGDSGRQCVLLILPVPALMTVSHFTPDAGGNRKQQE